MQTVFIMNTNDIFEIQTITDLCCLQGDGVQHAEAVTALCARLNRLNPMLTGDPEFEPYSRKSLEDLFKHDGVLVIADKHDDVIVGIGILSCNPIGNCRMATIQNFVVDETIRKQGIGTRVMERLFEFAKANGYKKISLTSHPSRTAAHALYEKMGFKKRETDVFTVSLV